MLGGSPGLKIQTWGTPSCFYTILERSPACRHRCRILTLYMPIETEIKFLVENLASLNRCLQAAGFILQTPRAFESNVLYDTPDRQMRARTEILRIRNYAGRCILTHKRLPDEGPGEDTHKHRIETETEISDDEALAEVFLSLGLVPAFRYEKWRAEWSDGEGHCVIDETPIGNYAELEGAPGVDRPRRRSPGHRSLAVHYSQLWPPLRPLASAAQLPRSAPHLRRRVKGPEK